MTIYFAVLYYFGLDLVILFMNISGCMIKFNTLSKNILAMENRKNFPTYLLKQLAFLFKKYYIKHFPKVTL